MNIATSLAFILRFPLALVAIFVAVRLLVFSINALKLLFYNQSSYLEGSFLLHADAKTDLVHTYKLKRTNIVGKMRSADIRFKGNGLRRRHATIYFFKGKWWVLPTSDVCAVTLNGIHIKHQHQICHQDCLRLGDVELSFIDEMVLSQEKNDYDELDEFVVTPEYFDEQPPNLLRRRRKLYSLKLLWLGASFFYIVSAMIAFLSLPQSMSGSDKQVVMILWLGVLGAMYLSRFAWRRIIAPQKDDSTIYLGLFFLINIGILIQTRLAIFGYDVPSKWLSRQSEFYHLVTVGLSKQIIFLLVGIVVLPLLVLWFSRTSFLEKIAPACLIITPLLYVATLVVGRGASVNGASLWIPLPFGMQIQLTEFAKISYLLVLALFFKIRPSFKQQVFFAIWAGAQFFLIVLLPDLGSAMILLPVTLVVFFVMTSEYLKTIAIMFGGIGIGTVAYYLLPYIQRRFHGWITLWDNVNPQNSQIVYGLQAVSRGGLWGRGIGLGTPDGIPVVESDMVFAAVAEELGLLVGISVVLVFFVIWLKSISGTIKAVDGFKASLILGAATILLVEALLVIGGSTGLMPLTGVTLPFISYGGSSVLAKYALVAIILGLMPRQCEFDEVLT